MTHRQIHHLPPPSARLDQLVERLADRAGYHDENASFPADGILALHEAGLLTASVTQEHGGAGYGVSDIVELMASLGRGDPSVALIALMNLQFHANQGSGDPRAIAPHLYLRILNESRQRPTLLNAFRAEPDLGTPARGGLPATRARYSSEGWILSGRKMFCTGSTGLDYHLPWAVTDEAEPRVAEFLVPAESDGIEILPTWNHLGMRATQSHDVVYHDVVVPHDHIVNPETITSRTRQNDHLAAPSVLAFSALYIGVARAAQDAFHRFCHERVPTALGRPIATTERMRTVAGEIELNLIQAESLLRHFASGMDAGDVNAFRHASAAKTLIASAVIRAVEVAVKALGNPSLSRSSALERHWRDVLCARVHSQQEDYVLLSLGTESLARNLHPLNLENRQT
ncbi:acyl-CoA/acyl-ACP dehydrogenase [Shinella sp. CPCC 101442]|uniref:acyl-CoA dehydrogenase family protein n=1 Tax=Shinella sp. CPCC 101442 TaxID=2932265 RepID=UPI002152CF49|nr:acyl-CoA dehydrogenase family protein [Shinella sp. CPCC 101442]MCR6502370.1 acyl-CoA/acyl-ACP dehydrogenase [Shinella sp. CPCC 101442]